MGVRPNKQLDAVIRNACLAVAEKLVAGAAKSRLVAASCYLPGSYQLNRESVMGEPTSAPHKPTISIQKVKQIRTAAYIVTGVMCLIIFLIILGSSGSKSGYSASTTGYNVVDDATLSVSFKVTNHSNTSGDPTCTITAQSPTGNDYGTDQFQLSESLSPGQTTNSADTITISNQGANNVTQTSVSCR